MNFQDLKIIVSQIKKNITCPKCESKYIDEDIDLIGSLGDEQTFVHAACHECEAEVVINVSYQMPTDLPNVLPNFKKLGSSPRHGMVTTNEVLDMHNFLKNFKGDFKNLFNVEKTNKKTT